MKGIGILIAITVGTAAQAGQQLHFKTGKLSTKAENGTQVFRSQNSTPTAYQVIQFKAPIRLADQKWLKSLDIEVLRYVPDDAYIARLNNMKSLKALYKSDLIQAVLAYEPEFRLNQKSMALSVFSEGKKEELHIRSFKGVDHEVLKSQLLQISGLMIQEQVGGAFIVNVPVAKAKQIASIEGVEWIDLYHAPQLQKFDAQKLFQTQDNPGISLMANGRVQDLNGFETGTKIMNFQQAWSHGLTGKGQIVAVADTGLDSGDMATLNKDFKNLVRPYIGGINSTTWGDPDGHGTHVAGSVLNSGASTNGKIRGGAYEAGLIMESMHSSAYGSITIGPDPSPLFEVAYQDGARIHSNSWGSPQDYGVYNDSSRAVDEFMFENQDMLILFSAGNEGVDANQDGRVDKGSVTSPSTAKNALTVGSSENLVAVGGVQIPLGMAGNEETGFRWPAEPIASDTMSNSQDGLAAFSSRGPTRDGRLKPDVVAPGTNILSNCSQYPDAGTLWGAFNKDYCFSGGTSMSTPLVAAAAALVRQNLIENTDIKSPSAALIKGILMHSAVDMYPGQYGRIGKERGQELLKPGPNIDQGYGRVDVSKAIERRLGYMDEKVGVATGEVKEVILPLGTRKVTLVYTDAPGSTAAQKALVNNLDMEVHAASGKFFTARSKKNNVEQILIPKGSVGLRLKVKGTSVPMGLDGRQPYSVVYSR